MESRARANKKTFWQFLFPYIIVLCIPLLIGTIAYYVAYSALLKQAEDSSLSMLRQSQQILDSNLATIDKIMESQLNSSIINQFANVGNPFDSKQIGKLIDLNIQVTDSPNASNLNFRSYLLFTRSNLSISAENNCSLETFYNRVFRLKGQSYIDFYRLINEKYHFRKFLPVQDALYKGADLRAITCLYSIGRFKNQSGAILVFINEKEIIRLFQSSIDVPNAHFVIFDSDGVALFQSGPLPGEKILAEIEGRASNASNFRSNVNNTDVYITHLESGYNGWHYALVQPTSNISSQVYGIFTVSLLLSAGILLAGLVVSVLMALRSTFSMLTIIKSLEDASIGKPVRLGPFGLLKASIGKLIEDRDSLAKLASEQSTLVQSAFMEKILRGSYVNENEMAVAAARLDFSLDHSLYCVASFYLHGYNDALNEEILAELNGRRRLLAEYIQLLFSSNAYIHIVNHNCIAALFGFDGNSEAECRSTLEQSLEKLYGSLPVVMQKNLLITVGRLYPGIGNVSRSYGEAQKLIHGRGASKDNHIRWYSETGIELMSFYYPSEMESRLIGVVRTGSHDETQELLTLLYKENFVLRDISDDMLSIFVNDLASTAVKLLSQNLVSSASASAIWSLLRQKTNDPEADFNQAIRPAFLRLCTMILEQKDNRNNGLTKDILDYLNNHYTNPGLSLASLADAFQFSEVYMSQFFKANTGENFSVYLENLRINQAKSLLLNSDMQVQEIALKTGYQSSNTFCRAFKRVTHTNAGDYRELMKLRNR